LTPAEKLRAISSPMASFVSAIYNRYDTLSLIMDTKRARPFQLITHSIYMIERQPERYNATLATITKYLKNVREVPESLKASIDQVYTIIEEMIEANVELIRRYHNLSPVEFVFLTYMIAKLPELSITQYQNHLLAMKEHVWAKHDDVRFNNKVFNTLKEFVDDIKYASTSNYQASPHTSNTASASSSTRRKKKVRRTSN
jgi:hypothetical protein